jgi:hypothetical protein
MLLALATFAWRYWLAYVLVTIIFEAIALGRWLRVPFAQAFKCSLEANLLTALIGGFFSGLFCAALGFYGGRLNPNPFGQTLMLFTLFGSLSAIIEASVWMGAIKKATGEESSAIIHPGNVIARSVLVHLVGVPLGMAVLLIPARPYPGLEGQVYTTRVYYLEEREIKKALQDYIGEHQAWPPVHSYGELLQMLKPKLDHFANDPDLWAAAYVPEYHRFDTTEKQRHRIEWNNRASGYKFSDDIASSFWLIRSQSHGFCEGLVLDSGGVKRTADRKALGYDDRINSAFLNPSIPGQFQSH